MAWFKTTATKRTSERLAFRLRVQSGDVDLRASSAGLPVVPPPGTAALAEALPSLQLRA